RPFQPQKEVDNDGIDMDTVGNYVGSNAVVAKDDAENPRVAMIKRPRGVECVRRVPRAGLNGSSGLFNVCIGVSQAHGHSPFGSLPDNLQSAVQLGRDCHQQNMSSGRLPHALEDSRGRTQKVFRRMHTSARVAEERAFQMDPDWSRPRSILSPLLGRLNGVGQPLKGGKGQVQRRRDSGWAITAYPVTSQQSFDRG